MMTDEESAAFLRGFSLAQPPGPEELDALERASEFAPAEAGHILVAVPKDVARAILSEVEAASEDLAGAVWAGFIRGTGALAGGAPVHVHDSGRA